MGKFANTPEEFEAAERAACEELGLPYVPREHMQGMYVGKQPWMEDGARTLDHGRSEFEALGFPVPFYRRSAGIRHLKDMGWTDRAEMEEIVGKMVSAIERDDSHEALEVAMRLGVDTTGCYRMLSVLLCEPRPANYAAA